jgi:DNA-binding transcriptional regulator YhcF (GntR family)
MISSGKWNCNSKLPSILSIAETLGVSYQTVRNVVRVFEKEGMIENFGSIGFFVTPKEVLEIKAVSKNRYYSQLLKANLNAYDMIVGEAKQIRNWIISYDKHSESINCLNIVSNSAIQCTMNELNSIRTDLIRLENIIGTKGAEFASLNKRYKRQQELIPIAKIVFNFERELGINV